MNKNQLRNSNLQASKHEDRNQVNYETLSHEHDSINLHSTLLLAYRDIHAILQQHFYDNHKQQTIRYMDFGCGTGLSTEIYLQEFTSQKNMRIEATGVDVSLANLAIAKSKLPQVNFLCIQPNDDLARLGKFDLITCTFVLVEMPRATMLETLKILKSRLTANGILIVTNTTSHCYHPEHEWHGFTANFNENTPAHRIADKTALTHQEDQQVKVEIFTSPDKQNSYVFYDYYHSEAQYLSTYQAAGLNLIETYKPLGCATDNINWKSESQLPPYQIHILELTPK